MKPFGPAVRVYGALGRRRVDLDGAELDRVSEVTVTESADSIQLVTVSFFTNRATVEPPCADTVLDEEKPHA